MTPRALRRSFVVMVAALLAACDLGPSGPGTVRGTVAGNPDLGGVVLEVTWPGVIGFAGQGSTQVYSAPVAGAPDRHRVILISPTGGDLPFEIHVDDAYLESPTVTVVEAVGTGDNPVSLLGLQVVLVR